MAKKMVLPGFGAVEIFYVGNRETAEDWAVNLGVSVAAVSEIPESERPRNWGADEHFVYRKEVSSSSVGMGAEEHLMNPKEVYLLELAMDKLAAMMRGEVVITNDEEMDLMQEMRELPSGDPLWEMRSLPNPDRVGILDQYIAWIGGPKSPSRKFFMGAAFRGQRDPDMVLIELERVIDFVGGVRNEAPLLVEELFRMVEAGQRPHWDRYPAGTKYYRQKVREAAEQGLVEDPVDALNEILAESDLDYGEVSSALESAVDDLANQRAAEAWSTPGNQMLDDLGAEEDEVWIEAEFGDWIAVNGDLVLPGRPGKKKPGGYVLTDRGGRVPTTEEEVQVGFAVEKVARDLKISEDVVQAVADQEGMGEYVYTSVSGDVDVWVLRPDIRKYSTRERKHRALKMED